MLLIISSLIGISFLYHYFTKDNTDTGCEKTVSKSGAAYRLIAWTVKQEPQFKGYCPFFWSTWLCIFLLPFTCIVKAVEFLAGFLFNRKPEEICDRNTPTFEDIEFFYDTTGIPNNFPDWVAANPNWREDYREKVMAFREKKERAIAADIAKKRKKSERREFINSKLEIAGKYTGWMVKPALIISAFLLSYGIFRIFGGIAETVSSGELFNGFLIAGAVVVIISFIKYLLGWVRSMARVVQKEETYKPLKEQSELMTKFWDLVTFPFRLAARLYKKECPLIKYED